MLWSDPTCIKQNIYDWALKTSYSSCGLIKETIYESSPDAFLTCLFLAVFSKQPILMIPICLLSFRESLYGRLYAITINFIFRTDKVSPSVLISILKIITSLFGYFILKKEDKAAACFFLMRLIFYLNKSQALHALKNLSVRLNSENFATVAPLPITHKKLMNL
jgi:hypothetical protein